MPSGIQIRQSNPGKGRSYSRRSPSPHSGEEPGRSPLSTSVRSTYSGLQKRAAATKQKAKTKTKHKKHRNTLAASRPKKGPRKGQATRTPKLQENPKNARGPEWHPRKHQETGCTATKGDKPTAAGQKKTKPVRVGVYCYYLIYIC